jgi:hypothetical protein
MYPLPLILSPAGNTTSPLLEHSYDQNTAYMRQHYLVRPHTFHFPVASLTFPCSRFPEGPSCVFVRSLLAFHS